MSRTSGGRTPEKFSCLPGKVGVKSVDAGDVLLYLYYRLDLLGFFWIHIIELVRLSLSIFG